MDKKGGVTFFRRSFFVPNLRKISWANLSVFQNYSGFKIFWIIGVSLFCRLFLYHNAEKFRRGPLFFGKVLVSKKFWITSYHHFHGFFLSHVAENHRGRTRLCFRNILVSKFFG